MTHHLFHTNFQTEKVQPLKTHLDINKFINQPIYPLKTYSSHSQVTRTSKMSSKGYSLEDRKRHIVKHEYHDHDRDPKQDSKRGFDVAPPGDEPTPSCDHKAEHDQVYRGCQVADTPGPQIRNQRHQGKETECQENPI